MTTAPPNLAALNRTLDQELCALVRGVSLECLVCGEFVLHARGALACPECRSILAEGSEIQAVQLLAGELPSAVQAG
jgi:Zn finger protein HypA/HybF involved in hydrogenase expression